MPGQGVPPSRTFHLAPGHGKESIEAGGILGHGSNGVAVHDGVATHRQYPLQHGLCNARHLRELLGIHEATVQHWPVRIAGLLIQLIVDVNRAKEAARIRLNKRVLRGYRHGYRRLVREGESLNPLPPPTGKRGRPALALLKRLDNHQDDLLRFARHVRVDFGNNQAEQHIRMVKLQQKMSGSWRSWEVAEEFLSTRSFVGTARKSGKNALDAFNDLVAVDPWLPATRGTVTQIQLNHTPWLVLQFIWPP